MKKIIAGTTTHIKCDKAALGIIQTSKIILSVLASGSLFMGAHEAQGDVNKNKNDVAILYTSAVIFLLICLYCTLSTLFSQKGNPEKTPLLPK
jgi:uncharacterized membrane protein YozB (DUF420 family)